MIVAALIVMEFLIGDQEVSDEISACVGVDSDKSILNGQTQNIHEFGKDEV